MTMGQKIQQLRKSKGLSQEELSSMITVSRQAISKWELDESVPDTDNIVQICKIFGVSADYLLNDEVETDMDIPVVRENYQKATKQYNRKLWIVLIGAIIIISIVVGIINNSIITTIAGIIFIGFAYLVSLIIKALCKYTKK